MVNLFSSFKRKGGGVLTQKVTADLVKRSVTGRTELGSTDLLNVRNGATVGGNNAMPAVAFSCASYQANDPCADALILESSSSGSQSHVFAAVLSSARTSHGGEHLRRHLYRELLQQLKLTPTDPLGALKTSLVALDVKFRALHLYNASILSGTQITAAYLDLATNKLHLISNGGCRAVVSAHRAGVPDVIVELGRPPIPSPTASDAGGHSGGSTSTVGTSRGDATTQHSAAYRHTSMEAGNQNGTGKMASGATLLPAGMRTVQLTEDVESVILGSPGFWRELTAQQAALRAQAVVQCAPHATGGNVAAHLTQLALQAVAARSSRQISDPRMASLRSTSQLQQLWVGSRANYRWGGRQPLRRRRGDVHGDLTAVVLRLDWDGGETLARNSMQCKMRRVGSAAALPKGLGLRPSSGSFQSLRAKGLASHWDLVRMHFLGYTPIARAAAHSRWYAAVDAACAASRANQAAADAKAAAAVADVCPMPSYVAGTLSAINPQTKCDKALLQGDGPAGFGVGSEEGGAVSGVSAVRGVSAVTLPPPSVSVERCTERVHSPAELHTPAAAAAPIAARAEESSDCQADRVGVEWDSRPQKSSASGTFRRNAPLLHLRRSSSTPLAGETVSVSSVMRVAAGQRRPQLPLGEAAGSAGEDAAARRRTLSGASRRDLMQAQRSCRPSERLGDLSAGSSTTLQQRTVRAGS